MFNFKPKFNFKSKKVESVQSKDIPQHIEYTEALFYIPHNIEYLPQNWHNYGSSSVQYINPYYSFPNCYVPYQVPNNSYTKEKETSVQYQDSVLGSQSGQNYDIEKMNEYLIKVMRDTLVQVVNNTDKSNIQYVLSNIFPSILYNVFSNTMPHIVAHSYTSY